MNTVKDLGPNQIKLKFKCVHYLMFKIQYKRVIKNQHKSKKNFQCHKKKIKNFE